jgi:hypothetical protein
LGLNHVGAWCFEHVLKTRDRLVDGLLAAIGGDEHGNGDWKGNIVLFLGLAVGFIVRSLLCLGCVSRVGVPDLGQRRALGTARE